MEGRGLNQGVHRVDDVDAAKALIDGREWDLLRILINREASSSDLAHATGMNLPALRYRMKKLLGLGLVRVSRIEERKGSPIKHYRTTASHFFVPFRVTSSQTLADLLASIHAPLEQRLRHELARIFLEEAADWGLNVYGDEQAGFNFSFSPLPETDDLFMERSLEPGFPAMYDTVHAVRLDFERAKALQRDLHELYERYDTGVPGQQPYLLRLALVPAKTG